MQGRKYFSPSLTLLRRAGGKGPGVRYKNTSSSLLQPHWMCLLKRLYQINVSIQSLPRLTAESEFPHANLLAQINDLEISIFWKKSNKSSAIILFMQLKELLHQYQAGWKAAEEAQIEERRSASLELRWRQLNSAYGLAKGLGILKPDPEEMKVIERWATLKEKLSNHNPTA